MLVNLLFLVRVFITLKESVLDPQGQTVKHSLHSMDETSVKDVRIGKYIELKLEAESSDKAVQNAKRIIEKLLVNPVIESYSFEISEAE